MKAESVQLPTKQVHILGLKEVEKIKTLARGLVKKINASMSLRLECFQYFYSQYFVQFYSEFANFVKSDPNQKFKTTDDALNYHRDIVKKINSKLSLVFPQELLKSVIQNETKSN